MRVRQKGRRPYKHGRVGVRKRVPQRYRHQEELRRVREEAYLQGYEEGVAATAEAAYGNTEVLLDHLMSLRSAKAIHASIAEWRGDG